METGVFMRLINLRWWPALRSPIIGKTSDVLYQLISVTRCFPQNIIIIIMVTIQNIIEGSKYYRKYVGYLQQKEESDGKPQR